jgi:hypothetical protein
MAFAPRTVQNIPDCFSLPNTVLQPATLVQITNPITQKAEPLVI